MCGICGILGKNEPLVIERMIAAMRHRGPDDHGSFCDEAISLGQTRLAIIDVSPKAHQPMKTPDGLVSLVYNGETYNFLEEREILEKRGYSFSSSSDTEVVLKMYLEYGADFVKRIRGIFALAILDKRSHAGKEKLLLARDHLGVKPLLYSFFPGGFIFASELKALLASGLIPKEVDPESLRMLLTYGSILQPRTMIKNVLMLLPGHRMIFQGGKTTVEPFWTLPKNNSENSKMSYEEAVSLVKTTLWEAVSSQMVSDVPLGAFLSGGIDSSLLVALMTRICSRKVRTFSVGFLAEGSRIDESADAENIAKFLGTVHQKVLITGKDVLEKLPHFVASLGQPSVNGLNSYFVSQAAKRGVTVAISGTGGDELFAGYPWFWKMKIYAKELERPSFQGSLKKLFGKISRQNFFDRYLSGRLGAILDRLRANGELLPKFCRQYQIFSPSQAADVLSLEMRKLAKIGREPALDFSPADLLSTDGPVRRVTSLCLRGYLQNQLLRDIDAVSMGNSLEVRVPYLDIKLVELALSLPENFKIQDEIDSLSGNPTYRDLGVKRLLMDTGKDLLPAELDMQSKRGFAMPLGAWLHGPLKAVLEETLSEEVIKSRSFFEREQVSQVKKAFFSNQISWAQPWLLMITELWARTVLD